MKKYILTAVLILFSFAAAYAANVKDSLYEAENVLFGYDMSSETDVKRLERLEEYVYGEKKTGTVHSRLEALMNDSGITAPVRKNKNTEALNKNLNESIAGMQDKMKEQSKALELKEDETVEYTAVNEMEQKLFGQIYKSENIYTRLNRLENAVFQQTSILDLNTRVKKLSDKLLPRKKKLFF